MASGDDQGGGGDDGKRRRLSLESMLAYSNQTIEALQGQISTLQTLANQALSQSNQAQTQRDQVQGQRDQVQGQLDQVQGQLDRALDALTQERKRADEERRELQSHLAKSHDDYVRLVDTALSYATSAKKELKGVGREAKTIRAIADGDEQEKAATQYLAIADDEKDASPDPNHPNPPMTVYFVDAKTLEILHQVLKARKLKMIPGCSWIPVAFPDTVEATKQAIIDECQQQAPVSIL